MWILIYSNELLDLERFHLYFKSKVLCFFYPFHDHSSPETLSRLCGTPLFTTMVVADTNIRFKVMKTFFFFNEHSFQKKVPWQWPHQEDRLSSRQHFCGFAGKVFKKVVGIPIGKNCVPFLAEIFLYSYKGKFIINGLCRREGRIITRFNVTYRHIDDVLSINNPDYVNYLGQMYPGELQNIDRIESNTFASYLDLLLSIGRDGQLQTPLQQTWRFQLPCFKVSVSD